MFVARGTVRQVGSCSVSVCKGLSEGWPGRWSRFSE